MIAVLQSGNRELKNAFQKQILFTHHFIQVSILALSILFVKSVHSLYIL